MGSQEILESLFNEYVDPEAKLYRLQKDALSKGLKIHFPQLEISERARGHCVMKDVYFRHQPSFGDFIDKVAHVLDDRIVLDSERTKIKDQIVLSINDEIKLSFQSKEAFSKISWQGTVQKLKTRQSNSMFLYSLEAEFLDAVSQNKELTINLEVVSWCNSLRKNFEESLGLTCIDPRIYLSRKYHTDFLQKKLNVPHKTLTDKLERLKVFQIDVEATTSAELAKVIQMLHYELLPTRNVLELTWVMNNLDNFDVSEKDLAFPNLELETEQYHFSFNKLSSGTWSA